METLLVTEVLGDNCNTNKRKKKKKKKKKERKRIACIVLYLKIINTFFKHDMHLIANCPRNWNMVLKF